MREKRAVGMCLWVRIPIHRSSDPGSQGRRPSRLPTREKWRKLGSPSSLCSTSYMPCRLPGDEIPGGGPHFVWRFYDRIISQMLCVS